MVDIGFVEFDSLNGINWPDYIEYGGLHTVIVETSDDTQAMLDEGFVMSATLVNDPPTIIYSGKSDPRRRDNDICHEIGHMICSDVLGLEYEMTESDTQSIGNFIHALLEQVLKANGATPYESTLEIERATSMCEIASDRRKMAESMAPSDRDGESGASWPTGC